MSFLITTLISSIENTNPYVLKIELNFWLKEGLKNTYFSCLRTNILQLDCFSFYFFGRESTTKLVIRSHN